MGDTHSSEFIDPVAKTLYERENAFRVPARWEYYKLTENPRDVKQESFDFLKENGSLTGIETILDVGCSYGQDLRTLRESGHTGQLIGMEPFDNPFFITNTSLFAKGLPPVNFLQGEAQHIPLTDSSVDIITAFFMLYHVPNIGNALQEFQRVLKPDGKLVITTSSSQNKREHRTFEMGLGVALKSLPPPKFNRSFTSEIGEKELPNYFDAIEKIDWNDQFVIRSSDLKSDSPKLEAYSNSLFSMASAFSREFSRREFDKVFNDHIRGTIKNYVELYDAFIDTASHTAFICTNPAEAA